MANKARRQAEIRGRRAELWAEIFLRLKGYRILERRYKTPLGEIDIIARKRNVLAIVEVKRRRNLQEAHNSLHTQNLRRIENAAQLYQERHTQYYDFATRYDAVFVLPKLRIIHLKDAWRTY